MPYKILTYTNPYTLAETDFWKEIEELPHFCGARTHVRGLVSIMRDSIKGLICPFDDLIKREEIYHSWEGNISLQLQQYSYLTKIFSDAEKMNKEAPDSDFYIALQKNKSQFLDALRLFIELDIPATSLYPENALKEQRIFIRVLDRIQKKNPEIFRFPSGKTVADVEKAVIELAKDEKKQYYDRTKKNKSIIDPRQEQWYDRMIENSMNRPLTGIVIHGVHQFTPSQLRLIIELEKQGLMIYFLFNYQSKFKKIYSSWEYIYNNFDVPFISDGKESAELSEEELNNSNALGLALGLLCEGQYSPENSLMRDCYEKYKGSRFIKFSNLTEYARYVSKKVNIAEKKYYSEMSTLEKGLGIVNNAKVLSNLDEQVYTANRDIHSLLDVYHPEFSQDRHFLSYPIGQFFSGLYKLWNWETGEIDFDLDIIRECLASGLLGNPNNAPLLLRVSQVLEVILAEIETYSEFIRDVEGQYVNNYKKVMNAVGDSPLAFAKKFAIYNEQAITKKEIEEFIKAIKMLNGLGIKLFGQSKEDYIQFGSHFANLEGVIREKRSLLINEAEKKLINELLGRFENVKYMTRDASGTFDDLRKGLYFYLKQKSDEKPVDWIVKNFEQIDGDILQSKSQHNRHLKAIREGNTKHRDKIYHFACLSDRDMNISIDNLLPWPLTDQFILKAYSPVDLQFRVYYAALSERSAFLRYALFYGLYFNKSDVCLSFVEEVQDEKTEPYTMLRILGVEPNCKGDSEEESVQLFHSSAATVDISSINPTREQALSMYLCPKRYILDYIVNGEPVATNAFLYEKIFENVLIQAAWKRCQNRDKDVVQEYLWRIIKDECRARMQMVFFWSPIKIYDICKRAYNYCKEQFLVGTGKVKPYQGSHLDIRYLFGKALYEINVAEYEPKNPYAAYENETEIISDGNKMLKKYRLHNGKFKPDKMPKEMKDDLITFLMKNGSSKEAVVSEWCTYCTHKNTCLEFYKLIEQREG